jgi:hypothetical protein
MAYPSRRSWSIASSGANGGLDNEPHSLLDLDALPGQQEPSARAGSAAVLDGVLEVAGLWSQLPPTRGRTLRGLINLRHDAIYKVPSQID